MRNKFIGIFFPEIKIMASPNLKQCADQFSALSKEWGKGSSRNLEKCGKMLKELLVWDD